MSDETPSAGSESTIDVAAASVDEPAIPRQPSGYGSDERLASPSAVPAPLASPAPAEGRRPPRTDGRWRMLAGISFGVVVLVLLAGIGYLIYQRFYADPTRLAQPGHCLANLPSVSSSEDREVPRARIVTCTDPAAVYVVVGRLDEVSDEQASSDTVCQAFEDATVAYRVPAGGTGYVLCLRPLNE
ncbi:MAG TPA: hypothetical protein VH561_11555 [Micromonosporaceae bacterium]